MALYRSGGNCSAAEPQPTEGRQDINCTICTYRPEVNVNTKHNWQNMPFVVDIRRCDSIRNVFNVRLRDLQFQLRFIAVLLISSTDIKGPLKDQAHLSKKRASATFPTF